MEADLNGDCVRQTFVDKEVPVNASLPIMIISQMFFLFQRDDILDIQALSNGISVSSSHLSMPSRGINSPPK